MGHHHHDGHHHHCSIEGHGTRAYTLALLIALLLNAGMFFLEIYFGHQSSSLTLWADSLDFLGDTFSYASSIFLIGSSLYLKGRFAQAKAFSMGVLSLSIIFLAIARLVGLTPEVDSLTMGWVGICALLANIISLILLHRTKGTDSDSTAIWECTKNDVRANLILLFSAGIIFMTHLNFIDLLAACVLVYFSSRSIRIILKHAKEDIRKS